MNFSTNRFQPKETPSYTQCEPKTDWHALTVDATLKALHTQKNGLSQTEAENRQIKFGPNALPETNQ